MQAGIKDNGSLDILIHLSLFNFLQSRSYVVHCSAYPTVGFDERYFDAGCAFNKFVKEGHYKLHYTVTDENHMNTFKIVNFVDIGIVLDLVGIDGTIFCGANDARIIVSISWFIRTGMISIKSNIFSITANFVVIISPQSSQSNSSVIASGIRGGGLTDVIFASFIDIGMRSDYHAGITEITPKPR